MFPLTLTLTYTVQELTYTAVNLAEHPLEVDMSRVHVVAARPVLLFIHAFIAFLLLAGSASAQFTGNLQGTVEDPSGAAVPQAKVSLLNVATKAAATATTDATGGFRFLSLAPGSYKISVEAAGFARAEATVSLVTNQNLNVPISLKVGTGAETVTVTPRHRSSTRAKPGTR